MSWRKILREKRERICPSCAASARKSRWTKQNWVFVRNISNFFLLPSHLHFYHCTMHIPMHFEKYSQVSVHLYECFFKIQFGIQPLSKSTNLIFEQSVIKGIIPKWQVCYTFFFSNSLQDCFLPPSSHCVQEQFLKKIFGLTNKTSTCSCQRGGCLQSACLCNCSNSGPTCFL